MAAVPAANRARTRDSGEPRYVLPVRRYVVFIVAAVGAVLSAACHLNGCFLAWHRRTQTCATIPARSQRQDSSDESGGEDGADEVVEGGTPLHCEDRMEVQHVEDEETKLRRQLRERDARIAVLEASVISLTNSRSATSGAKAEREKIASSSSSGLGVEVWPVGDDLFQEWCPYMVIITDWIQVMDSGDGGVAWLGLNQKREEHLSQQVLLQCQLPLLSLLLPSIEKDGLPQTLRG